MTTRTGLPDQAAAVLSARERGRLEHVRETGAELLKVPARKLFAAALVTALCTSSAFAQAQGAAPDGARAAGVATAFGAVSAVAGGVSPPANSASADLFRQLSELEELTLIDGSGASRDGLKRDAPVRSGVGDGARPAQAAFGVVGGAGEPPGSLYSLPSGRALASAQFENTPDGQRLLRARAIVRAQARTLDGL